MSGSVIKAGMAFNELLRRSCGDVIGTPRISYSQRSTGGLPVVAVVVPGGALDGEGTRFRITDSADGRGRLPVRGGRPRVRCATWVAAAPGR
jgi:hypothetical protein